jgi:hypothetical protein
MEMRNIFTKFQLEKPTGNGSHRRPMHRWEDITMGLQERECEGMDWIQLAQDVF